MHESQKNFILRTLRQRNTKKAGSAQREKVFFVSQFIAIIGKQDYLANLFPEGPVIQQIDNNFPWPVLLSTIEMTSENV